MSPLGRAALPLDEFPIRRRVGTGEGQAMRWGAVSLSGTRDQSRISFSAFVLAVEKAAHVYMFVLRDEWLVWVRAFNTGS